jgi:hypothetical protein
MKTKKNETITTNRMYVFEMCKLFYFSPVEKRKTTAVDKPTEKR